MCIRADKNEKETIIVVASRGKEREKEKEKVRKRNGHIGGEGEIRKEERARESKASQMLASAWRWNVFKTKEGLI